MIRTYRLDDARQTLVLGAHSDRLPEIVYWGPALPVDENLDALHAAHRRDTHIITCQTTLDANRAVHLHWLAAPVLPAPQHSDDMIDFSGRWCGEFQPNRTAWSPGMRYRENRTGRTGHEHFPGLIVPQRHLRDRIVTWPKPHAPRPVHYNCWEAVYFDHKLPVLKEIAEKAAELGAERFVLDDGWFGNRDDDTRSLSDWTVACSIFSSAHGWPPNVIWGLRWTPASWTRMKPLC